MANQFLTADVIAREAMLRLRNNAVLPQLVYGGYQPEFGREINGYNVSETVRIRKPATFVANDFVTEVTVQDVRETSVSLTIEKLVDTTFEITDRDLTLTVSDFGNRYLVGAIDAVVDKIVDYAYNKFYQGVPHFYNGGTASAPAFPNTVAKLAEARAVAVRNKISLQAGNLFGLVNPTAESTLFAISEFTKANERGDGGQALLRGSLGTFLGFGWYQDQAIPYHTAGTAAQRTTLAVNGAVAAGATTLAIDGATGSDTLKAGDIFTVADVAGSYVVTADKTASSGAFTGVTFSPAAPTGGFPNDKAVTVISSHTPNLLFHRNAFALVTPPFSTNPDSAPNPNGSMAVVTDERTGLSVRVNTWRENKNKKMLCSVDMLCGGAVINPDLAVRVLGGL